MYKSMWNSIKIPFMSLGTGIVIGATLVP